MERKTSIEVNEKIRNLYQLIASMETEEDCKALFVDLCTEKEIEKMDECVYAAQLLLKGKTYHQIMAQSNIPSATLSRVSQKRSVLGNRPLFSTANDGESVDIPNHT